MRRLGLTLAALALMLGCAGCYATPQGGEVGVVRNGKAWYWPPDWFDSHTIRQTIPNGAGNTWTGMGSDTHFYPSSTQQRIYKFDSVEDADAPPVQVFTKDGVHVTVRGTFYLKTSFDGSKRGNALLEEFDQSFGTRGFGPDDKKPYEDGGWSAFLDAVLLPVIDSNLREIAADFECQELVSSCALVQRTGASRKDLSQDTGSNIAHIQDALDHSLALEIQQKLGRAYFGDIRFSLGSVRPSPRVQVAIDSAQAQFAKVSQAEAHVEQAKKDRTANKIKQQGYNSCHSCAVQDQLKALPKGLQALGGNVAVGIGGGR